jgi:CyaY protein
MMNDNFRRLIEDTLISVEEAVEESGAPIDYQTLERELILEFANNSEAILSVNPNTGHLLLHSQNRTFEFAYDADTGLWKQYDSGDELFKVLGRVCSEQSGKSVSFD